MIEALYGYNDSVPWEPVYHAPLSTGEMIWAGCIVVFFVWAFWYGRDD